MKAVTQRYFISHLKELREPVEVTLQIKGTGRVDTLGVFYPKGTEQKDQKPQKADVKS